MKIKTALRQIKQEYPPEIVEIFEAGIEATQYRTLESVIEILRDCADIGDEGTEAPSDTVKHLRNFLGL